MTIKSSVFNITKTISNSNDHDEFRNVINSLNTVPEKSKGVIDRSEFGYIARKQKMQVMGYVLINQHRNEILRNIPALEKAEEELLILYNNSFIHFNSLLINKVALSFPFFKPSLDPYITANYHPTDNHKVIPFCSSDTMDKLLSDFANHSAHKVLSDNQNIKGPESTEKAIQSVIVIQNLILDQGVHNVSNELTNLFMNNHLLINPLQTATKYILGLVVLRTTLQMIDQIIFQSFFSKKLCYFSSNNIISVKKHTNNLIGEGVTIQVLLSFDPLLSEPNNIVLIEGKILSKDHNCLGWIYKEIISFSEETGNIGEISLWVLDEEMNPFTNLLK